MMFDIKVALPAANTLLEEIKEIPYVAQAEIVGSVARRHRYVKDIDIVLYLKKPGKDETKKKEIFSAFYKEFYSKFKDRIKLKSKGVMYINFIYIDKESKYKFPVDIWIGYSDLNYEFLKFHYSVGKAIMSYKQIANLIGLSLSRYGLKLQSTDELTKLTVADFYLIYNTITKNRKLKDLLKKFLNNRLRKIMIKKNLFPVIKYKRKEKLGDKIILTLWFTEQKPDPSLIKTISRSGYKIEYWYDEDKKKNIIYKIEIIL